MWQGTEASSQQPFEGAFLEAIPPAPVAPSDDCSPRCFLTVTLGETLSQSDPAKGSSQFPNPQKQERLHLHVILHHKVSLTPNSTLRRACPSEYILPENF